MYNYTGNSNMYIFLYCLNKKRCFLHLYFLLKLLFLSLCLVLALYLSLIVEWSSWSHSCKKLSHLSRKLKPEGRPWVSSWYQSYDLFSNPNAKLRKHRSHEVDRFGSKAHLKSKQVQNPTMTEAPNILLDLDLVKIIAVLRWVFYIHILFFARHCQWNHLGRKAPKVSQSTLISSVPSPARNMTKNFK